MAIPYVEAGKIIDLKSFDRTLSNNATHTLIKTQGLELIRLILPAGKEIPPHQVPREFLFQCLEGRIAFTAYGQTLELNAGEMLYIEGNELHSLKSIENASALLTRLL